MKVFFNISYRSTEKEKEEAKRIYNIINKVGHKHTYDYLSDEITYSPPLPEKKLTELYSNAIKALNNSDIVVLEVSTNSFTQGYLLHKALELSKPVVALYKKDRSSIFFQGIQNNLLQTVEYSDDDLELVLKDALNTALECLETRFNFYLSYEINNYVRWVAHKRNLSKSAVLRNLLRDHMKNDPEYKSLS